jgi:hypothetical protein
MFVVLPGAVTPKPINIRILFPDLPALAEKGVRYP